MGRYLNPTKNHYNPEVLEDIRSHKSKVQLLPPNGHDLNPIELFNNIIQQKVKRWLPANPEKDEYDNIVPGPRTFEECQIAVSDALETLKGKSTSFTKMYEKRATGFELKKRMQGSKFAAAALKEREEIIINQKWSLSEE